MGGTLTVVNGLTITFESVELLIAPSQAMPSDLRIIFSTVNPAGQPIITTTVIPIPSANTKFPGFAGAPTITTSPASTTKSLPSTVSTITPSTGSTTRVSKPAVSSKTDPKDSPGSSSSTSSPAAPTSFNVTDLAADNLPNAGLFSCAPLNSTNIISCHTTSHPSNSGLKAGVGVLAACFIITLGLLAFLFFKRRKLSAAAAQALLVSSDEKARIAILERQLDDLNARVITARPTPIDDRTVAAMHDHVTQEIKDWAVTYFRGGGGGQIVGLAGFDERKLPGGVKTRMLVVRGVVGEMLAQAWMNGRCIPGGVELREVERGMARIMGGAEFNRWRCETYSAVRRAAETEMVEAVRPLAESIDQALAPFSDPVEIASERFAALHRIVTLWGNLAITMLAQPARFTLMDHHPGMAFACRSVDDVTQEVETSMGMLGNFENVLEGRPVQAVVVPGVEKWGNGELGVEGEWASRTVVVKSKVLV